MNVNMTSGLTQHWVNVVDAQGREQLQARWLSDEQASAPTLTQVVAHGAHAA